MPKVSVIVPCYNVEKFLPVCLESIQNQTFSDFEVICIDDGSSDKCGQILDDYASKDNRFKVTHKQNRGISVARNTAMSVISAPYTVFVDSDDVLHPQTLELAVKTIDAHKADMVWFDFVDFDSDKELDSIPVYNQPPKSILCPTTPLKFYVVKPLWRHNKSEKLFGVVWNKIYRSDLIKNIQFEQELCISEDNLFTLEMISKVKTIAHLKAQLYYYRNNPDSIMHTKNDEDIAKNLQMEMNGYIKLQQRIDEENVAQDKKKIIKKHIASFFFKRLFRPYLKQKSNWIEQNYIDNLLYSSRLDFKGLNIRYRIPLFLYQKGWRRLANLSAV